MNHYLLKTKQLFSPFMKVFLVLFFINITTNMSGQISEKSEPYGYFTKKSKKSVKFEKIKPLKNFIETTYRSDSKYHLKKGQFGYPIKTNITSNNSGKWYINKDNIQMWEVGIKSTDAKSIQVIFSNFELPPNGKIFIYNKDKTQYIGAFTYKNNKESKKLATLPVRGDEIIIQYLHENRFEKLPNIEIGQIIYDYKDVYKNTEGYNSSGDCNINVNCAEGGEYQNTKRAVARIYFDGYFCTGALVNNTNEDATPYFLTANHCIDNQATAETTVFLFNYESPYCNNVAGPTTNSVSGSDLIATGYENTLDFALLKLTTAPPKEFEPYFLGWDITGVTNKKSVCIHHPSADIKKISVDEDTLYTSNYGSNYIHYTHWLVKNWEKGTTEGGSSGSPLLNNKGLLIGDLTGGEARCSYNYNDLYQKLSESWDHYSSYENQLKHWLDPLNKKVSSLNGFDPQKDEKETHIENFPKIACPFDTISYWIQWADKKRAVEVKWEIENQRGVNSFVEDDIFKVVFTEPGSYSIKATVNDALVLQPNSKTLINPCVSCISDKTTVCTKDTIELIADVNQLKSGTTFKWVLKDAELLKGNINDKKVSISYKTGGVKQPQIKIADSYFVSLNNEINITQSPQDPIVKVNYHRLYIDDIGDNEIQWYRNTVPIYNETKPYLNVSSDGLYYAKISGQNGCYTKSDTLDVKLIANKEISLVKDIIAYPTIVDNGEIYIDLNLIAKIDKILIRVATTSGNVVIQETVYPDNKTSRIPINIEKLDPGFYIVHLLHENFSSQHKIIVR